METKTKILKILFVYKLNLHKSCSQLIPLGKLKMSSKTIRSESFLFFELEIN